MNLSKKARLNSKLDLLIKIINELKSFIIAYSGGTDSTLLLKLASFSKAKALAVTADSEIIPRNIIKISKKLTKEIGIKHRIIYTNILLINDFVKNTSERCYVCKDNLFRNLYNILISEGYNNIIEGTNIDDLKDYRPGIKALNKYNVKSPYIEAGISKKDIRELSKYLKLSTWDKPPSTCLATRIPYGLKITKDTLKRIEKSEEFLLSLGFKNVRVRDHAGLARIEVDSDMFKTFFDSNKRSMIYKKLQSFGYEYISIDIEGYKTGSLNRSLNE